jgi:hypothetical protein
MEQLRKRKPVPQENPRKEPLSKKTETKEGGKRFGNEPFERQKPGRSRVEDKKIRNRF